MRIAKIKNKYMFVTSENDNGIHYYAIFYNKETKRYNAIQLTHLYTKDKNRFIQVKKGLVKIEKFKEFDVPSGVRKKVYANNVDGQNIDINDKQNVEKIFPRYLSKKQSNRILEFVGKKKT